MTDFLFAMQGHNDSTQQRHATASQQQHCNTVSPGAVSMASDSTIMSNLSMQQQPSFKMEQI